MKCQSESGGEHDEGLSEGGRENSGGACGTTDLQASSATRDSNVEAAALVCEARDMASWKSARICCW